MKTYIVLFLESQWYSLNINDEEDYQERLDLSFKNTLISFQTSDLIRHFRSVESLRIPLIIDLECFDKQMSQQGKEFRPQKSWKALAFLKYYKIVDIDFQLTKDNIKVFLEHLKTLYFKLLEKDNKEKDRFEKLETLVNKVIHQREFSGVRVDRAIAKQKCIEIEKEIYRTKNILQHEYEIFSPDDERQQLSYLEKRKYKVIKSPLLSFKAHRNEDRACKLFYELLRNQQDLDSFIYILSHWGGSERTYPTYKGFGTITSRITLRQPSLQNLRRVNRQVIVPDEGKKILYIDYSQFEAGILASLSDEDALIQLYKTDIYDDLVKNVSANTINRSDAKIIFYRYMYGDTSLSKEAKAYFQKFKKLEAYKKKINTEIKGTGKIGTSYGNFRCCLDEDHEWSLSHVIQSTASFIYKNALIRVFEEVKGASFLIPMHDGTVYQIEELSYAICQEKIEIIYKEEFKKVCPQIEVRVNCSDKF